jgi:hypothetical protein
MSVLPKIDLPTYTVKLPISEVSVKYRPYNVKEQKILTMAKESGDNDSLVDAILQVAINCVIDATDISQLPLADVEFLFYQLRARSESEIVELRYKCENTVNEEGKKCNNIMEYNLNLLNEIEVAKTENLSQLIEITDKVGVKLYYERFEKSLIQTGTIPTPQQILEIIAKNIEFIYDENSAYSAKDIPLQNIVDWVGELPPEKYIKIEEFFANKPKLIKKLDIKCSKCGFDHKIEVRDIFDFFI